MAIQTELEELTLAVQFQQPSQTEQGLQSFIEKAFKGKMQSLIPFVNNSNTLLFLVRRLRRENRSPKTLYQYVFGVHRYTRWLGRTPDDLIGECFAGDGSLIQKILNGHVDSLNSFVDQLQDEGLAPGTINNHVKGVKAFYRANGKLNLDLGYRLSKRVKYKDRSPTPEELTRILDIGDLRDKVIVSFLATGGFREGTFALLQYRHVKKDFERGIVPLHIHVEAEIVKGEYGDYDTFLGQEAVDSLRLYLDDRRKGAVYRTGNVDRVRQPETITDKSPLIRDSHSNKIRALSPARLHDRIHDLYLQAGLISPDAKAVRYELRLHSIRKYFRTQLASLGVNDDYIEYMMGHTVSTYHDIQMKGVEFLRGIYAASGLSIRPKTQVSKLDMLKQVARAWGLDPDKILVKDASEYPHRAFASSSQTADSYSGALTLALKEAVRKDLTGKP